MEPAAFGTYSTARSVLWGSTHCRSPSAGPRVFEGSELLVTSFDSALLLAKKRL